MNLFYMVQLSFLVDQTKPYHILKGKYKFENRKINYTYTNYSLISHYIHIHLI